MTPQGKTVETPRRLARLYLVKAEQFAAEAGDALASSRYDAAMLNAVHAGISASDAVCVAIGGRRSSDPDHQHAARLLEQTGGGSKEFSESAKRLRMLLGKKNAVEYESRVTSKSDATDAVKRAGRLVSWAGRIVDDARV